MSTDASAGHLIRQGLDLVLDWADYSSLRLHNWRDGREGVKGELTVTQNGVRYSWGAWSLASTTARDGLAKRLTTHQPDVPWGAHLEEAAWRFTQAAREGSPVETLTGVTTTGPEMLLSGWLYAGEPTLLYADGDTGKSLTALTLAVAMHAGVALSGGLVPVRAIPAAYLDWETTAATIDQRLGLVASGLGIAPPPVLYKRMTRPLVDEIGTLSAELARRQVGFVVVDSQMFAMSAGEGAAFHEPMTQFYGALRLFAPAAVLVVSHVTNADARSGVPARPFGGAFAFNGPRLIWEAKRDWEIEDATAIVFTCRKANALDRKPPPFGLQFAERDGTIEVRDLDLGSVNAATLAGASLTARTLAMLSEPLSLEALVEALQAKPNTINRIVRRLLAKGKVQALMDGRWLIVENLSRKLSQPVPDGGGIHRGARTVPLKVSPTPLPNPTPNPEVRSTKRANTEDQSFQALGFVPSGHPGDNSLTVVRDPSRNSAISLKTDTADLSRDNSRLSDRDEPAWITEDA